MRELIAGVRAGAKGVGWNFATFYCDFHSCGTTACAAGHLPGLHPEWRIGKERDSETALPLLRGKRTVDSSLRTWFGLSQRDIDKLFYWDTDDLSGMLRPEATREEWCAHAEAFLQSKGFGTTPTVALAPEKGLTQAANLPPQADTVAFPESLKNYLLEKHMEEADKSHRYREVSK